MGPYNAGPKSALFLRVALLKAGVRGAILEREYHVFEKFIFFSKFGILYPFLLTNFLTNIPIKSGNKDLLFSAQFETGVIKAGVMRAHKA